VWSNNIDLDMCLRATDLPLLPVKMNQYLTFLMG